MSNGSEHHNGTPIEEIGGYRIHYESVNGSGRTRVTVTEALSGRQVSEEIRPNAIGGGTQSIRDALIRQLARG
ncbi:MAG TPA: hypothetical protein DEB30_04090 [Candidatus Peribacter riflensis]|uniref:Uncharacterized protein n=1 Tax=Candidatus Peribacter riflensis TaxID=1735162 RepID=A0A0S1SRM0_9BACT|nr:MAG: hypothetical protein PeribacterA2_0763 [Candidatus Peribacter riflensis]OGJ77815.1 MAG: hypothetical protein A2398_00900 [Candidatus Peribacteria bacterium RIFOXYB1_FULL_57_12]OGJ82785.1 MAG: hypothetical protein A2412_00820 [Candidatus Peribacteria bacterium RIFOXYC1_FULL_58_8]ALM11231.1 MAG: hypothetical protein PeribacterB2_0765 [Candidatus Peribacter riflensis]ALM12334.1 MAG: hypothetical protein PeribacterC2_0765 [Candidatus Peribacter riflensis]